MFCQKIGLSPNHTLFLIFSSGSHFSGVFLYRTLKFATKNSLAIVKQSRNGLKNFYKYKSFPRNKFKDAV
jgi:hypothetical protein